MSITATDAVRHVQEPRKKTAERRRNDSCVYPSPAPCSEAKPQTVLIIDGDDVNRNALNAMLADSGYRIALATSADEACEFLRRVQPDVILCDPFIHGVDSNQFCHWLKSYGTWRHVPIIAVARVDDTATIAAVLDAGADDVIVKPAGKARELVARVAAALRIRDRYLDLAHRSFENLRREALAATRDS